MSGIVMSIVISSEPDTRARASRIGTSLKVVSATAGPQIVERAGDEHSDHLRPIPRGSARVLDWIDRCTVPIGDLRDSGVVQARPRYAGADVGARSRYGSHRADRDAQAPDCVARKKARAATPTHGRSSEERVT